MFGRMRNALPVALAVAAAMLPITDLAIAAGDGTSNRNVPYLRIGAGARALGMGGAFVGVADDATAAYWNPAGLTWMTGWEVTGMYTGGMNVDRSHNYVSFARNSDWGAYAASWQNAGMSDIEQRGADGRLIGDFNFSDNALQLSLAKRWDVFALGLSGKYLRESIGAEVEGDDAASGFGLDLGAGLELTEYARVGVSALNIAGKLGSVEDVNDIPATLRAGVGIVPMDGLTAAFDVEKTRDEDDYRFHAGAEYAVGINDDLGAAVRMGLNHDKFAGGLGISFDFLRFDYAYVVEPETFLDENHRFSITLGFDKDEVTPRRMSSGMGGDRDGDGISDDRDQCPDQPEDFDGFADTDGCPDPDNDGDGLADANDDCPNQAEDFDGFQDSDGCPDMDNDNDGILDTNDQCPNAAENFNNFEDADGCPDQAGPDRRIPALAYINFKFGTAEISGADPIPVLEDVVRVMKEDPSLRLRITGHTDNVGSEEANQNLSERRAETIKNYLVNRGVPASSLETTGKGESTPVDTNDTDLGRARNRRTEFTIVN